MKNVIEVSSMAETMSDQKPPEQRVFGDVFSFKAGVSDDGIKKSYFEERIAAIRAGDTTWLSRTFEGERGIAADLFKDGKVVASLDFDYDTHTANVYVTSEGGVYGDTTLCNQTTFDNAVNEAEKYALDLDTE